MVDVTLSLIGANGDEIVFSDEGDFVLTSGLAGLGIPATQVRIDDSASDGGVWRFSKRGVRELDLPVVVFGADRVAVEANLRRLNLLLNDRDGGVVLQAAYSSGEVWHLTQGHYVSGASGVRGDDGGLAWERWVLSLQFANPFWVSQASESFAVGAPASTGSFLPNLAEMVVSSAQAVGSVTVENPGDVDAFPVWSLRGPADSVTISNGSESFVYNAPILASSTVVVDTAAGTVTDQAGVNKYGSLGVSPSLFSFPAGTSQVSVTATNASAGSWNDVEVLATNYVKNSSMEASSGSSAIRTNLLTNPSMESVTSGAVVMRRNYNLATNWTGSLPSGWTITSGTMASGVITQTGPTTTNLLTPPSIPITAGQSYSVGYWVQNTHATETVSMRIAAWNGNIYNYGEYVAIAPGEKKRVILEGGIAAAGTTYIQPRLHGVTVTGVTWKFSEPIVEFGSKIGDFFSGDTTDALGWDYAWSGTANASISTAACAATTVRTNLLSNPSFELDAGGWSSSGTSGTRVSTQSYLGSWSYEVVATAAGQGAFSGQCATTAQTYTASAWVKGEAGKLFNINLREKLSDGTTTVGDTSSANITATGSWQRVSVSRTFGATGAIGQVIVRSQTSGAHTFYVDAVMLEASSTVGDYFDGSFSPAGDFSYAWTGTANASTSIQRGATEANYTPFNSGAVASREWMLTGNQSLRIVPTGAANYVAPGGEFIMALGMTAGNTYTVSGTIRLSAAQTGTLDARARRITFFYKNSGGAYVETQSTQAANAAGVTRLSVTVAIPAGATEAFVRLYNGAPVGGGDVWWDNVLLEASPIVGAYFDGTTTSADSDFTIAWNGYAHASTSSYYADAISGINGMTPVNAVSNRSSQWFKVGTKSYRIIPTQLGNESYGYTPTYTITPGKQYTATGVIRIPEPLLGTLHADALKLRVNIDNGTSYVKTSAAPNIAGEYTLTTTFTAPEGSSTARIELMNGASAGNGNVWWDTVGFIDKADSPFFDGASTALRENGYAWTGTANDSTSTWSRREIQGATLISCNYQPRKEIVH